MYRIIFFLSVIVMLNACGNDETSERKDGFSETPSNPADSLFKDVMDGHDVAMAKMGRLAGYRKQVDQKIDSLKRISSAAKESVEGSLKQLGTELKDAEEGMNRWMEEFNLDSAQDDIERRIDYLKSEKIKVDVVKEKILSTIAKADSLLKK